MSASHGAAPTGDRLRGPLTKVAPTTKVLTLLAFLLAVGLTPNGDGALLAGWLGLAVVVATLAFVDWRAVARRLVLDVPLVVLGITQAVVGRGPRVEVVGLSLSRPGLTVGLAVLAKASIGVVAVSAIAASTTVPETMTALRRLGLPGWFCTLVSLAARQVEVLRDELAAPAAGRRAPPPRRGPPGGVGRRRSDARVAVRPLRRAGRPATARRRPPRRVRRGRARPPIDRARRVSDLLLIGHGSREPAAAEEFARLRALVADRATDARVRGGFLELAEPPIDAAVDALVADGATDVVAVPYVLFGAGHLKDDGPAVLARARRRHPQVRFRLARDLGLHPAVLAVAEDRARTGLAGLGAETASGRAVVVVGRGSTDPDACADLAKLARLLGDGRGLGLVEPAFMAMTTPNLDDALERCRRLGATDVVVLPLFLFSGVLVDRIADAAHTWAGRHPALRVGVADHLGPDPRLAAVVVERAGECDHGDVRMNCDLCAYRVRLPGYEEKLGTPLSVAPPERAPRGWRARRAANQSAEDAAVRRERPRLGLGRRTGIPTPPARPGPAIRIAGLAHRFPDGTQALAGVDLVVAQGERVAILGPNGSGKTTLALHLVGALERGDGSVEVTGRLVVAEHLAEIRRRVGFVFQDPDDQLLLPTVAADVAYGPANQGITGDELRARVAAALEVVGLADLADRTPQQLSLGERRRVALAGVLASHPEVLVLDEPTANLDPAARRDLVEIVRGLDVTTLVITHDLPLAAELCPRSVVLAHGRVAVDGPTSALLANPGVLAAHRLELPYQMVAPAAGARTADGYGDPGHGTGRGCA